MADSRCGSPPPRSQYTYGINERSEGLRESSLWLGPFLDILDPSFHPVPLGSVSWHRDVLGPGWYCPASNTEGWMVCIWHSGKVKAMGGGWWVMACMTCSCRKRGLHWTWFCLECAESWVMRMFFSGIQHPRWEDNAPSRTQVSTNTNWFQPLSAASTQNSIAELNMLLWPWCNQVSAFAATLLECLAWNICIMIRKTE